MAATNLKQLVEEHELYIVALSSSSLSDQLAIIPDRIDDLYDLSGSIRSSKGVEVHDTVRFFIGDHPAQQFERGTQLGRVYKCGSCECPDVHMGDFAYACRCRWRSLADLQALVLAGKHGNKVGVLKPFARLSIAELREELHARGFWETDRRRKELDAVLIDILKSAQRVPSLLTTDPKQDLGDLNLSQYAVLGCEPLHDLEGHLTHLLTELPNILVGEPKRLCTELLEGVLFSKKEGGYTGSDLRVAIQEVYKFLYSQDVSQNVKLLIQTAAKISYS